MKSMPLHIFKTFPFLQLNFVFITLISHVRMSHSERKTGVVIQSNEKLVFHTMSFVSETIFYNTSLCGGPDTMRTLQQCTCLLTTVKQNDIISYTEERNLPLVEKFFQHFGFQDVAAISKLSRRSVYFQEEHAKHMSLLVNQFNVRGTTVLLCRGFDKELQQFGTFYRGTTWRERLPTVVNFNQSDIDINRIVIGLYLVKSADSSVLFVMCPEFYTALLLEISNSLAMESTRYVWILQSPVQLLSSSIPKNVLSVVPVIVNKSFSSIEEHVLLTRDQTVIKNNGHTIDFCNITRKANAPIDKDYGSYMDHSPKRNYIGKVLTLKGSRHWKQIGTILNHKDIVFQDSTNILATFPRYMSLKLVKMVTIVDPPYVFLQTKTYWKPEAEKCQHGHICWRFSITSAGKTEVPECCVGFLIDLLEKLKRDIGLETWLYIVEDSTYGSYNPETQKWSGMIGDLISGKAEMALASLTITSGRSKVVIFTEPFMNAGIGLVTLSRADQLPFVNFEFLKPLSLQLWVVVFGLPLIFSFLMIGIERISKLCYSWREAVLYLVGLTFQRDLGGKNPRGLGTRTATITVAVATMIIMSTYTAVLTANKVSNRNKLPITGFRDNKITNPTKSFIYGSPTNSAYTSFFKESTDPAFNRMYQFMKPYNFLDTKKAIESLKAGHLDAIIHDYIVLYYFVSTDPQCQLQFAGDPLPDPGVSLAVTMNSWLKLTLSDAILKYKDDGSMTRLRNKWMNSKCISSTHPGSINPKELTVTHFGGLVLVTLLAAVVSCLCYLAEYLLWRYKTRLTNVKTMSTTTIENSL